MTTYKTYLSLLLQDNVTFPPTSNPEGWLTLLSITLKESIFLIMNTKSESDIGNILL